ncbi:MAG: hypothetical protein MJ138_00660 [Kiritimatiellae bacterium]|nr:hypothetical protein [Kiritimatiellia bacterium]
MKFVMAAACAALAVVAWGVAPVNGTMDVRPGKGFRESWFDDSVKEVPCRVLDGAPVAVKAYLHDDRPAMLVRRTDGQTGPATFSVKGVAFTGGGEITSPVRVDLADGTIREIPELDVKATAERPYRRDGSDWTTRFHDLPLTPDEQLVACRYDVPIAFDWTKMPPEAIVNCLYRPGMNGNKKRPARAAWMDLPAEKFLPFIDVYGQFKYRTWPGKTTCDADLKRAAAAEALDLAAHPGPADRDVYGGWTKGPKQTATGRFYPKKADGKWWLVDPLGNLFWSFGAVRVTPCSAMTPLNGEPHPPWRYGRKMPPRHCFFENLPKPDSPFARFFKTHDELLVDFYLDRGETEWYDFSSSNLYRKYGEGYYETFADLAHRRLRSWGLNTIANSSDVKICLMDRTPYAERIECHSRPIAAAQGGWWKFRDPWDPSFVEGARKALEKHGREAHDPWCIGFFVDNELGWGDGETDLARWTLASPDDQPAKIEFLKRLAAEGKTEKDVTVAELRAFTKVVVEEYFRKTRDTLKEFDKDLLYLGCRFCGAPRQVVEACAKYADVVSYNIYSDSIERWRLPSSLDRPVMIGEFHFGAADRGPFGVSLIDCGTQEGRAAALVRYVESALANPQIVGVHWHQFSDQATTGRFDGEYFQVGFTDVCDTPYPETIRALRDVGGRTYAERAAIFP